MQNLRDKMPKGYIAELTDGSPAQKMTLFRIFHKPSAADLSKSERDMLDKFLKYANKHLAACEKIENKVGELAK